MPINPHEAPPGYRAVLARSLCAGCAFNESEHRCSKPISGTPCVEYDRDDGIDVIFIRDDSEQVFRAIDRATRLFEFLERRDPGVSEVTLPFADAVALRDAARKYLGQ